MTTINYMAAMGDSLTSHRAGQVRASATWPTVLARLLNRRSSLMLWENNMGIPGDTTAQMLARCDEMYRLGTPGLTVIYTGANDLGTPANVQPNLQAMIKAAKFRAIGAAPGGPGPQAVLFANPSVANVAALPASGRPGQRYIVLSDSDTAGGQTADALLVAAGLQLPTITGTLSAAQTVWEYRNPLAGNAGWGRVATDVSTGPGATSPFYASGALQGQAIGCPRIVVVTLHYTVTADTPSAQSGTWQAVRTAIAAAAAAENVNDANGQPTVIVADLYTWMRNMIVGGTLYGTTFPAGTLPNYSSDTGTVARTPLSVPNSPGITYQVGTLSGAMVSTGLTSIPTTATVASGQPVVIGYGTANQESVWATGPSTGTAVPCTATANTHSSAEEVSVPNLHLSEYGNHILSQCVGAAIASQSPDWLTGLAA